MSSHCNATLLSPAQTNHVKVKERHSHVPHTCLRIAAVDTLLKQAVIAAVVLYPMFHCGLLSRR